MDEKLVWEWRCANHIVTPVWCSDGLGTRPLGKRAKRLRTETQKAWPWFECFLCTFALIGFSQNVCIILRYYTSITSVLWSISIPLPLLPVPRRAKSQLYRRQHTSDVMYASLSVLLFYRYVNRQYSVRPYGMFSFTESSSMNKCDERELTEKTNTTDA